MLDLYYKEYIFCWVVSRIEEMYLYEKLKDILLIWEK